MKTAPATKPGRSPKTVAMRPDANPSASPNERHCAMSKVKKPQTGRKITRATAFKRIHDFRRAVTHCGGRCVGHGFALIKTPTRSAMPFNVALRLTADGRLFAYALHQAFDLGQLRQRLDQLGFRAHSVRTAGEATRRNLLNALMHSAAAGPRLFVEINGPARIVCSTAEATGLAKSEGRNARQR